MGDGDPNQTGGSRGLPPEAAGLFQELAQSFLTLQHAASFYPVGHQARERPLLRLHRSLLVLIERRAPLVLGFSEHELFWEGAFYGELSPLVRKLLAAFTGGGIARVTFQPGFEAEELQRFVSLLAAGRGAAGRRPWAADEGFPHIAVEGIDYQSLMAEDTTPPGAETARRRDLWKALLARCMQDPEATLTPEELQLLQDQAEDPAALGAMIAEGLGPGAWTGSPETVAPIRRLTDALERASAAPGGPTAEELRERFRKVGRTFPDPLRFRLLEASLGDEPQALFSRSFGSPTTADLVGLMAKNFQMDTEQISRLTRVFQNLVPRQLDRMELFPQLKDQVEQRTTPEDALPENAWGEVQELLTGELGEFMSPSYRELMQRLSAREDHRRGAEDSFAELAGLVPDLEGDRIRDEALHIHLEALRGATTEEHFRAALDHVVERCRAAFATGNRALGFIALRGLAALQRGAGAELPASSRAALEAGLQHTTTPEVTAGLAADFARCSAEDQEALGVLFRFVPEPAARGLVSAVAAEEDPARRRRLGEIFASLGEPAVTAVEARLGTEPPGTLRNLLALLGELKVEATVPAIVAALGHADPKIRREALRALIRIDTPEARRPLPELLGDSDEELMQLAATHLGTIGHQASRKDLLRTIGRGNVAGLRTEEIRRAAVALGRMRAPEAVAPLARLLRPRVWVNRRAQEELCTAAAHALKRIGTAEARQALEREVKRAPAARAALFRRLLAQWGTA